MRVAGLPLFNLNTQKTAGNDKVNFAAGERVDADYIDGGADDDVLYGNTGNDYIFGGLAA